MLVGLALFVALVYVVVVLGGGLLIGHTESPQVGLSILATALVAFGFEPVQSPPRAASPPGSRPPRAHAVRHLEQVLGSRERHLRRRRGGRADGAGAHRGHRCPVVTGVVDRPGPADAAGHLAPRCRRGHASSRQPRASRSAHAAGATGRGPARRAASAARPVAPMSPVEQSLFAGLAGQAAAWCSAASGCGPSGANGSPSCRSEPRSSAAPESAWSTPRTRPADVWSVTSTTAPSSIWWRWP